MHSSIAKTRRTVAGLLLLLLPVAGGLLLSFPAPATAQDKTRITRADQTTPPGVDESAVPRLPRVASGARPGVTAGDSIKEGGDLAGVEFFKEQAAAKFLCQWPLHGGIERKLTVTTPRRIVLIQNTVTTKKGDMFPGLKIDQANKIPGNIRSDAKTADIASQYRSPLLTYLPLPSQA